MLKYFLSFKSIFCQAKIQAEKDAEIQAKMDAKIQAENDAEIQGEKTAEIQDKKANNNHNLTHYLQLKLLSGKNARAWDSMDFT